MPVNLKQMSIDAKVCHHVMGDADDLIDLDGAAAEVGPALYDPDRRLAISKIAFEVVTALASGGPATVQLGTTASAGAYGTVSVATTDAAGSFVTGTILAAGRDIPKATRIIANHVDTGTSVGDGILHIWYYRRDNSSATQEA